MNIESITKELEKSGFVITNSNSTIYATKVYETICGEKYARIVIQKDGKVLADYESEGKNILDIIPFVLEKVFVLEKDIKRAVEYIEDRINSSFARELFLLNAQRKTNQLNNNYEKKNYKNTKG